MHNWKYQKLYDFLSNMEDVTSITLTFSDIENIIKSKLPQSAKEHDAWWGNENNEKRTQAKAWMQAGWKVENKKLGEYVIFTKN